MTNHTDTSPSGDLMEQLRKYDYNWHEATCKEAADRIEALEAEVERLRNDSWFEQFEEQEALRDDAEQRLSLVEAKNERLCGVLEAVWKEATTMRNASKLVGPYPKEPANNRVWARSMYHAGKKLHELIKPVRAALREKQ